MGFTINCEERKQGCRAAIVFNSKKYFDETTAFIFENEDRSIRETVNDWLAEKCVPVPGGVRLTGSYESRKLLARIDISIEYTVVNEMVIRKKLLLHQPNIPFVFYQVENTLRPARAPVKLWSFDNADHQGGIVHGTFPAIGFTDELAFGLLSDAGHRNLFTRNIRRRPGEEGGGFKGIYRTADAKMLSLSYNAITLCLGCLSDYHQGQKKKILQKESFFGDMFHAFDSHDGFYTLSFDYKAASPLHVRILKGRTDSEVRAFHYQSSLPFDPCQFLRFEDTFFLSDTEGQDILVKIWEGDNGAAVIQNLQMFLHEGLDMPYHMLSIGGIHEKNTFIFAEPSSDIRSLRLSSQVCLAEGLGFKGTTPEKVLFADMQMLTWITGENDLTPLNVPSINYAPDMYNRDSFWSVAGVHDAALSKAIFDRWGATQTEDGGIGTIVTPCMGSTEVKDNEAACEWIWWAWINLKKYGIEPPLDKIRKAFDYCVRNFDPDKTGICRSHYVLGQNDVTSYPDQPTSDLSVNQGMWAVTLMVARALDLHRDDVWIARAQERYKAFYDHVRGYLINDRRHPDVIACGDLLPEFVSLWLFNKALLTDEMVVSTLERIPRAGPFAYIIAHTRDGYFNEQNKPFDVEHAWPNGVYYNGASWMREEVMAYAAGAIHGWNKGRDYIAARMQGEIDAHPEEPFSHEFIPTDPSVPDSWWPSTRVFCWNVFALTVCEVVGMRRGASEG